MTSLPSRPIPLAFLFPVLPAALLLAACGHEIPVLAGVTVASIPVMQRTPVDLAVSAISGRDCSVVHWDKGERYCLAPEPPPEPPPFCTRSLGVPDCWADPMRLPGRPKEIADGPRTLTPEQNDRRMSWWKRLW